MPEEEARALPNGASWGEYRRLVVETLDKLDESIRELRSLVEQFRKDGHDEVGELRREMANLRVEFAMQKVKVGAVAVALGSIPSVAAALIWYISHGR